MGHEMKYNVESVPRILRVSTSLVSDNVTWLCYFVLALFICQRSFGLFDFGITPWHLFAVGVAGACLVLLSLVVKRRTIDNQLTCGLREAGFTDVEISELPSP